MAVGQPFGQGHSVTHGIISAKGRFSPELPLQKYIQTDAPINPGNSGGPLVNLRGEVIGINNAIDQRAQGIGFAIPVNVVKAVLPQLKSKGIVSRGYIGVGVKELNPDFAAKLGAPKDLEAPFVTQVYPGEPADKAGLRNYDIITHVAGKSVRNSADLINAVTAVPVGDTVAVKILRAGKEMELKIKVAQRPGAQPSAKPGKPDKKKGKKSAPPVDTGMTLEDVTPEIARDLGLEAKTTGVVVSATTYGGPADRAGLIRGDVILEVDRKPVKSADDFFDIVKDKKSYLLRVRRADPQGREDFTVILLDLK
jgi:serine protease Do